MPQTADHRTAQTAEALEFYADAPGLISAVALPDSPAGHLFTTDPEGLGHAAAYIAERDHLDHTIGVYLRNSTVTQVGRGRRGGDEHTVAWRKLCGDLDYGKPGYAPDAGTVLRVVGEAVAAGVLPQPTRWVHSGHGLYPEVWLEEWSTDLAARDQLADLYASAMRRVFTQAGYQLDPGRLGADAARVWRVPGTTNRKDPTTPVVCMVMETCGVVYSLDELRDFLGWPEGHQPAATQPAARLDERTPFGRRHAEAYIRGPAARFTLSTEGGQNNALNALCMALGHFVTTEDRPGLWSRAEAEQWAEEASRKNGYAARDPRGMVATIRSGLDAGISDPFPCEPDSTPPATTAGGARKRTVQLVPASSFVMRATDWLWDRRIPVGGLTLVAGREGDGKSTLTYRLLAEITRGTLSGDLHGTPRNVAVAATEDSWEMTIVPRLVAAGADLARVFHVKIANADGVETVLQLPHDIEATEHALRDADVPVLLLDPLMSRLEGRLDTHKDSEVRQGLEPLVALADRARCAVIGLIHLNKSNGSDPLNAIMASRAFVAVARSVLFVMRDPEDEQRRQRMVGLAKANLTADDDVPTLNFTIESQVVGQDPDSGKAITAGALHWGEESGRSIRDALTAAAEDPDVRSTRDEAAMWLKDYLMAQGGGAPRRDIVAAGRKEDFSETTLKRAAGSLRLEMVSTGFPRVSRWSLPGTSTVRPTNGDHSQATPGTPRSGPVGPVPGESDLTGLTERSVDRLGSTDSVSPVGPVSPCPPESGPTGPVCERCRHESDEPLVLGRCRQCAYPSYEESA